MLRKTLQVASVVIVVGSGVLLTACTTMPTGGTPVQAGAAPLATSIPDPSVQIKVTGTADQWMAFDKALRPLVGTEPLRCFIATQTGSISDCDILQTGPVPGNTAYVAYEFFGGHTYVYDKFGAAFDQVSPKQPMLTVTRVLPVAPDCGPPFPCVAAPYCPLRCAKTQGSCTRC
jgi:hypothetical protein